MLVSILGVICILNVYLRLVSAENSHGAPYSLALFSEVLIEVSEATLKCSHPQLQFQAVQSSVSKKVCHFLIEYFQKLTCPKVCLT